MAYEMPSFELTLGDTTCRDAVSGFEIEAARGECLATLTLDVGNQRRVFAATPALGAALSLRAGYGTAADLTPFFTGTVCSFEDHEGGWRLRADCLARQVAETTRTVAYKEETALNIVTHLLDGLDFVGRDFDDDTTTLDKLSLRDDTCLHGIEWLDRRLGRTDRCVYATPDGVLHWRAPDLAAPVLTLAPADLLGATTALPGGRLHITTYGRALWHSCRLDLTSAAGVVTSYLVDQVRHHLDTSGLRSEAWLSPLPSGPATPVRETFCSELKHLVEALAPDLRPALRLALVGRVIAVKADAYRVDVSVGGDEDTGAGGLVLPDVPVATPFAQSGYGLFALPEVGAEVTVSFHEGDVTQPYVEGSLYRDGQSPACRSGELTLLGKKGQIFRLSAESNTAKLSAEAAEISAPTTTIAAKTASLRATTATLTADTLKLGGASATEPAVLGTKLSDWLTTLLNVLQMPPIGNMGAPCVLNPGAAGIIAELSGKLTALNSKNVYVTAQKEES